MVRSEVSGFRMDFWVFIVFYNFLYLEYMVVVREFFGERLLVDFFSGNFWYIKSVEIFFFLIFEGVIK